MFAHYGVTATRDLGLDDWPTHGALLDGFPYIPVLLPDDSSSLS